MVNKLTKADSTSLVTRKMQNQTTTRFTITPPLEGLEKEKPDNTKS